MKTLLVFRHAKSSWDSAGISDHDRPLNGRGKNDAPNMGDLLRREDLVPGIILSSTAKRAHKTAKLAAESAGFEGELRLVGDFYLADPETYIEILQTISDEFERVMIVGHNPGMEELVSLLTDESIHFTTANIAHVELPVETWAELSEVTKGRLVNLWRPKELS